MSAFSQRLSSKTNVATSRAGGLGFVESRATPLTRLAWNICSNVLWVLHEVLTKTNMADEEEDYMSDAFLLGLEDTKPGLAFGAAAREYKKEANRKQKETENRVKPLKQRESERREKALSNAIDSSNKGFALLQKMGYKEGKGLGKHGMILCILF